MPNPLRPDRRKFLGATGALAAAPVLAAQPKAAKRIRVGLIGCGSVSGIYLPHLTKAEHVEVVSTCDIVPERAEKRAKQFKIANNYPHIDKMLDGVPFDLLVNTTDMQEHGRLNKIALEKGKNVWSEKPLANTYEDGAQLVKLAKEKGVRIWGAPAVVNSPQFAYMSKQLQAGTIGKPTAGHAHYGHLGPGWSAFFYEKNGGSIPDLGVYNLTSLTGLLGPAKAVTAMLTIVTPRRKVDNKGDIRVEAEDNAMVLMDHGGGTLSHMQCGFNYFDPHGHEGKDQDRPTISIVGTGGAMHLVGYDWEPNGVDIGTLKEQKLKRVETDAKGYVWQEGATKVAAFLAGLTAEPLITVEHSLHILEIWEAARQSQETGKRVPLRSTFKWPVV